jgi:hypothetical protein
MDGIKIPYLEISYIDKIAILTLDDGLYQLLRIYSRHFITCHKFTLINYLQLVLIIND